MSLMFCLILLLSNSFLVSNTPVVSTEEKNLTTHEADDRYASYSPDGKTIIFESNRSGNWDVFVMDANGKNQRQLTKDTADDRRPSWHPDGKKIIFESNRSGEFKLYKYCLKNNKTKMIEVPGLEGTPIFARYSPDGKKIAFSERLSDDKSKIVVTNKKGNKLNRVAGYGYRSFYPSWSSDGQSLLFFSRHETANADDEIYTMNTNGGEVKRLTNWPKHNFCPAWSSDGKRIAYVTSMEDRRPEIYIMDADGNNNRRVTFNEDGDTLPSWSADNTKLLITGYRGGNYEICELSIPIQ